MALPPKDSNYPQPQSVIPDELPSALLSMLVDVCPQAMLITNTQQQILLANQAASTLLQQPISELRGRSLPFRWIAGEPHLINLPGAQSHPLQAICQVSSRYWEGKTYFFVYLQPTQLLEEGQSELAERKLWERLRQCHASLSLTNAELERNLRMREGFLASMSHELRTPLNAILGITEGLSEHVYGTFNEQQLHALDLVKNSSRHLLNLINTILDLSKINAGKLELDWQLCNLGELGQACLRQHQVEAQKKQLKTTLILDSQVDNVLLDPLRLKQTINYLLDNAIKFTPEGGRIGLEIEGDLAHKTVNMSIWDTGIGIPEQEITHVLEPFSQLDNSLARQYGGMGLGLTLAYRLVELHGGSLSVQSKPSEGSRFTLHLPWNYREQQADEVPIDSHDHLRQALDDGDLAIPMRKPKRILLVEDNEGNLLATSDYLRNQGYQIIEARNGVEAVEIYQEAKPNFIIMDIQLPKMDGLEAIRQIRTLEAGQQHVPIIAVTALAMSGDEERCKKAGADLYLSKPVRFKTLVESIAALYPPL